jgi:hypothetical protein
MLTQSGNRMTGSKQLRGKKGGPAVWYQAEMVMRDRQERIRREADEARMARPAEGRAYAPAKPRRIRLFSRS